MLIEYRADLEKMTKLRVNDLDELKICGRNTSLIESQLFIQI